MERDEAVLDLDSRRRIYGFIEKNPGLHLRALQRALEIPLGTLEYHLYQLERSSLVAIRDEGRYKAFFAQGGDLDRRDKDILYYVRQEVPRLIVMQLLMSPGMGHGELTTHLPVSASTCSFHIKKLVQAGLVHEERVGRGKRFRVVDAERVARVIVRYRKSFLDDLVDRFARAWMEVGGGATNDDDEGVGGRLDGAIGDGSTTVSQPDPEGASDGTDPTEAERVRKDAAGAEAEAERRPIRFAVHVWLAHLGRTVGDALVLVAGSRGAVSLSRMPVRTNP